MKRPLRTLVATATLVLPLGCGEEVTAPAQLEAPQTQPLVAAQESQIGVFRKGFWVLDADRNQEWSGDQSDFVSEFGRAGDKPFVISSANCSGTNPIADIGVVRGLNWHATYDDLRWQPSDPTFVFTNDPDVIPLSWPDGKLVAFKNGTWFHDKNGSGTLDGGDGLYSFGRAGDLPVIGNLGFGGEAGSIDLIVFRPSTETWHVDGDRNSDRNDGFFKFGTKGDIPVVGDFNTARPHQEIAVFRPSEGKWYVDFNGNFKWDGNSGGDQTWKFGDPGDIPVVATWFGNVCP